MTAVFDQALSLTVFALLTAQESHSGERFADAVWALENTVAPYTNASVAARFLAVGAAYYKQGDRRALMRLSREERALFMQELKIEPAPQGM